MTRNTTMVRLQKDTYAKLRALSDKEDVPMSILLGKAVEYYIKHLQEFDLRSE